MQVPKHDCRHPHDTAPVPHAFCAHSTSSAPPASIRQTWPGAQVCEWQNTPVHGPVSTLHAPLKQLATVRPLPAQSS